jgi:hypothetical protein
MSKPEVPAAHEDMVISRHYVHVLMSMSIDQGQICMTAQKALLHLLLAPLASLIMQFIDCAQAPLCCCLPAVDELQKGKHLVLY